ncbi:MAG: chromate transporter [Clostridia bacterium]|nr:chromate transporter [Clostridia bacterium]
MEQELSRAQKLWKLFVTSLYISAFTFGGGFVIITFMKRKYVDEFHWIDDKEMLDLTALAQTSPGAIAVNAAILVGWRVGGVPGAALAVLGTIIPPMVIILVISLFYAAFAANKYVALVLKGMQAGVAAVILDVVCNLGKKVAERKSLIDLFIVLGAFAATFFFKVNVVFIILIAGLIGVLRATLLKPKGVEK